MKVTVSSTTKTIENMDEHSFLVEDGEHVYTHFDTEMLLQNKHHPSS